jgi:hypothetical protein
MSIPARRPKTKPSSTQQKTHTCSATGTKAEPTYPKEKQSLLLLNQSLFTCPLKRPMNRGQVIGTKKKIYLFRKLANQKR